MTISKGVRKGENSLWASDFREGFWEMVEAELGLKGRKWKKGEKKVFFFSKNKSRKQMIWRPE